ncbi:exodeoxyribonuclease III [Sutterella sp.]|uniref:exodeoxyribonuclease III n=1 Tax=Sutterella sp. TaxID=1981025 RepID=UPI0026E03C56|nr:exodeoxyribonuclease III [Sutterella sp.]MDO5530406.1 exodeoxyribonuclease III [Sutterella sp.]
MLRILTFNANGIRSAARKGFLEWFARQDADILCVQELKAQIPDLPDEIRDIPGYRGYFHCAEKRGYSGCGLWTRIEPAAVRTGFGDAEFDAEGRYVEADFGALTVISAYFPSGTSSDERQAAKYRFLERFALHLQALRDAGREVVLTGDVNIAHKEIDLKNWKGNLDHSGFLPEERAWLDRLFSESSGWVDVFRRLDPRPERYTWWSQRGQARAKNVGWRIDYQIATPGVAGTARATDIYAAEKFSDHAPLWVDYDFDPVGGAR